MYNIPILILTFNRLLYTKKAISALMKCRGADLYIIDDGSTDGTTEWLFDAYRTGELKASYVFGNMINIGIAGCMNRFLHKTKDAVVVGKVDCDTIVSPDFIERMLPHLQKTDVVQAKHTLIAASGVGTFDEWTGKMPRDGALAYNSFVGGSGILFKRRLVDHIPETKWKLGGWREWQRQHPEVSKGFACDVEIELLDENGYQDYPEYYTKTGRL